jgi:tetratricopeptide (TPR) repeat protein
MADERKFTVWRIVEALAALSGAEWEVIGHRLAEHISGVELRHRGLGLKGNAQGRTLDSYSADGTVAAEYGTEAGYFKTLAKPKSDVAHVRELLPTATSIYLLSTQKATPERQLDLIAWEQASAATDGISIHVFDSEALADYIVEHLLFDDMAFDELARYFEPLRRLRDEYAASNQVPQSTEGMVERRDVVDGVTAAVRNHGMALVWGISGIGKTEAVIAATHELRGTFERTIWVRDLEIADAADLRSVEVTRGGIRQNLLGSLSSGRCLLVLDDLRVRARLEPILAGIRAACGAGSAVIVTSQVSAAAPFALQMPFMDEREARILLQTGVAEVCPQPEFEAIWNATGGHPMALILLRGLVGEDATWADAAREAQRIGGMGHFEKQQRLVDLVFARWRRIIEDALAFFAWSGTPRVHLGLMRAAVSAQALPTLRRLGLVREDQPESVRLHDIAWASLEAFDPPLQIPGEQFARELDAYAARLAGDDRTLAVNHLARIHQPVLRSLIGSGRWLAGHLFAWLHQRGPGPIGPDDLPDPTRYAEEVAGSEDEFKIQTAVELAEAMVTVSPRQPDAEAIGALIRPFDVLLAAAEVGSPAWVRIRHHRAKALKRLRRHDDAVEELTALIAASGEVVSPPSVRLLLARTLTELPADSTVEPGDRPRDLLLGILDQELAAPGTVSESVTLAAAELLRRRAVSLDVAVVLPRYAALLEPLIISAAQRGLEQGPLAFGALSWAWRQTDSAGFERIVEQISFPAVGEVHDFSELEAWGEILSSAAEHGGANREALLGDALEFFRKSPRLYGATHAGDVLIRLGRPDEAIQLLEPRVTEEQTSNQAWVHFRLSQAYAAVGETNRAAPLASEAERLLPGASPHAERFRAWADDLLGLAGGLRRPDADGLA